MSRLSAPVLLALDPAAVPGFFSSVSDPAALTGARPGQPRPTTCWPYLVRVPGRPTRDPCAWYRSPWCLVRGPWTWCSWPRSARPGARYLVRDPWAVFVFVSTRCPVFVTRWPGSQTPRAVVRGPRAWRRWPWAARPGAWCDPPRTPGPEKRAPVAGVAGFSPISHGMFHVKHFSTPKEKRAPFVNKVNSCQNICNFKTKRTP